MLVYINISFLKRKEEIILKVRVWKAIERKKRSSVFFSVIVLEGSGIEFFRDRKERFFSFDVEFRVYIF